MMQLMDGVSRSNFITCSNSLRNVIKNSRKRMMLESKYLEGSFKRFINECSRFLRSDSDKRNHSSRDVSLLFTDDGRELKITVTFTFNSRYLATGFL